MSAALRAVGKPALPALLAALGDKDPRVRAGAISALGGFRAEAERVVPALDALLRDKDLMVRELAVRALGSIGSTRVEKVVPAGPRDAVESTWVQEIGPASKLVLGPLERALHDDFPHIRVVAEHGLGGLGPLAVPVLIKAAKDPDRTLRLRDRDAGHDPPDLARDGQRTGSIARRP